MKTNKFAVWDNVEREWANFKMLDNNFHFLDQRTKEWVKDEPNNPEKRFIVSQYLGFEDNLSISIYEGDMLVISLKENAEVMMKKEFGDYEGFTFPEELRDLKNALVTANAGDGEDLFYGFPLYMEPIPCKWHRFLNMKRVGSIFQPEKTIKGLSDWPEEMVKYAEKFCAF